MNLYDGLLGSKKPVDNTGLQIGIVRENYDEENKGKLKVEIFYGEEGMMKTSWVRAASSYAGDKSGFYALPEIGTEVLVAYINNNKSEPVVIGSLWNDKTPLDDRFPTENNTIKAFKTKSGHEVIFDEEDDKGSIKLKTIGGLNMAFTDEDKAFKITDQNGKSQISLDFENGKIIISAENTLILEAGGKSIITLKDGSAEIKTDKISLDAAQKLSLKGQNAALEGSGINIKSDANIEAKAGAMLKLEGSAMTELKGGLVKIN